MSGWELVKEMNMADEKADFPMFYAKRGEEEVHIEWGSDDMSEEAFALWLSLGLPGRNGPKPLNERSLMHLASRRLDRLAA